MVKKSKQKQAIIQILKSTSSHPTADWIFQKARMDLPNISLGTIYRNLRLLRDKGEILELRFNSDPSRYDGRTDSHYHFECYECKRVFDVDTTVAKQLGVKVLRETGYEISQIYLHLCGLCPECQDKKRSGDS